jgi:hypothetical protein
MGMKPKSFIELVPFHRRNRKIGETKNNCDGALV